MKRKSDITDIVVDKAKQDILAYFNENPDAMNIEAIIDLQMDKLTWDKASKELLKEGKVVRRVKRTFTMCDSEDFKRNTRVNNKCL